MNTAALLVEDLHSHYGKSHVLQGVNFAVPPGSVVALLGRNGAGKTTTLRSLMRLLAPRRGRVELFGRSLDGCSTAAIARLGMTLVPEHRGIFPSLSVRECLEIATHRTAGPWTLARVLDIFPRLGERLQHRAHQLSGGEQQMLAIGRALLLNPRLLLIDEPTQGLAPVVVRELLDHLLTLKRSGLTIVLVEQNLAFAERLADRFVILGKGAVQWTGSAAELEMAAEVTASWLGV